MSMPARPGFSRRCARVSAAAAAALVFGPVAFAQTAPTPVQAAGDVQVLSGGVGEGERARLAEQARGHNLKLVFTMSTGNYLAEVPFEVMRGKTTVVKEESKGPWAFVKLPAGSYTVRATYEGRTQTKRVSVPKTGQKRLAFVWPATDRVAEQPQPSR
jgi:hypothetical protein